MSADVVLVATTHWDREWYRTFQAFRARLVDVIDIVLDLLDRDPGYTFLLDGQTIVCEDYAEIRPENSARLKAAVAAGRVSIGPWYVQPDSFLPSGEAHIRNLLEGRRAGEEFGPVSRVGYTPDSFGHPAQFPQILAGFGIGTFVYWRGNGDEIAELPAEYVWTAPDGSTVVACHLWRGYFNAAGLSDDPIESLRPTVSDLASRSRSGRVLLLAGVDHQLPETRTRAIASDLAAATGWRVRRGLLEDFVEGISSDVSFSGELCGGRVANLLPGVWSTRTYLKLLNRRCETELEAWAEPWSAVLRVLGGPDESASLRMSWRQLLQNQAHDSICGCSQDAVHDQMVGRYDASFELARETTRRALDRIAGTGAERRTPWEDGLDVAVFNPSPHPRTDVVRFALDPYPLSIATGEGGHRTHPLLKANTGPQPFTADGEPAFLVAVSDDTTRVRRSPADDVWEAEFVVRDVPAFGYKRVRFEPSESSPLFVDDQTAVHAGDVTVEAAPDGTLSVGFGDRVYAGLFAIEDVGDRGDTYDFDPVPHEPSDHSASVSRWGHPGGLQYLSVVRQYRVPQTSERPAPPTTGTVLLITTARVAPGVGRVDVSVRLRNFACDHRVRLLFPTGEPCSEFEAASTFDVMTRRTGRPDDSQWRHPSPATFPHQGFMRANGLTVCAPGLPEGEVMPDGTIAVTLLRAVGWLSLDDLTTRPGHAGPAMPTPGAECVQRPVEATISLFAEGDPRDAEVGLRAVPAGDEPMVPDGRPLVTLEGEGLAVTAFKPSGEGVLIRVLNTTSVARAARLDIGFPFTAAEPVRLDETPATDGDVALEGSTIVFVVPAKGLRSVRLT